MLDSTGHRSRVKQRFRQEGLDHFHEVHALELLLFYCVPRVDTKPLARALIDRFGSFAQVLDAAAEELEKVPGVGENVSTFLKLVPAAGRYYMVNRAASQEVMNTVEAYGNFLMRQFIGLRNETVFLMCLDAKCKLLSCQKLGEGSVNSANVSARRIVEVALGVNATTVVLAHNHTSGIAVPSAADVVTTRQLGEALGALEICLADHIVVADADFVSMRQSGLYRPEEYCQMG